jgi:hypothetical protein
VLSGRGFCDGPIPRPEESYRLWCVSECDQVKIKTPTRTVNKQVEEGRTTKRNIETCCLRNSSHSILVYGKSVFTNYTDVYK